MKEGMLPPRPGEESSFTAGVTDRAVPILVDVNGETMEMTPVEALALAGRITAAVECWMRQKW
jgi:hypothetical protein